MGSHALIIAYLYAAFLPKLSILSKYDENIYYVFILIGIFIIYLLIQPIISWFVTLESTRLLSYIISSLIVLLSFMLVMRNLNEWGFESFNILKIALQCLASFGIGLILYHGVKRIFTDA